MVPVKFQTVFTPSNDVFFPVLIMDMRRDTVLVFVKVAPDGVETCMGDSD